jgi:predicted PurR-regulated permease PerM
VAEVSPKPAPAVNVQLSSRVLLMVALGLLSIWVLFNLWEIVVIVAAAFIFMAAALPYVEWLVRHGVNRVVAVLLLMFAVLAVLGGILALVVPALIEEGRDVHESLPEYGRKIDEQLAKYDIESDLEQRAENIEWGELLSGRAAVDFGQRAFVAVLSFVTVIVITAYLLVDAPRLSAFVYQFVSPGREPGVQRFLESMRVVVGGYIRGQVITSVVIAAFTSGVLFALGLPNAIAFGVLAAFADIIPLVGATLAIAPSVLIALDESVTKAVIVLVALLAYQQFEDRYLTPKVYGSTLNLPPIIVLITVLVGGKLFGVSGVLLALPAAAAARVVLDYYLQQRRLSPGASHSAEDIFAPDTATQKET